VRECPLQRIGGVTHRGEPSQGIAPGSYPTRAFIPCVCTWCISRVEVCRAAEPRRQPPDLYRSWLFACPNPTAAQSTSQPALQAHPPGGNPPHNPLFSSSSTMPSAHLAFRRRLSRSKPSLPRLTGSKPAGAVGHLVHGLQHAVSSREPTRTSSTQQAVNAEVEIRRQQPARPKHVRNGLNSSDSRRKPAGSPSSTPGANRAANSEAPGATSAQPTPPAERLLLPSRQPAHQVTEHEPAAAYDHLKQTFSFTRSDAVGTRRQPDLSREPMPSRHQVPGAHRQLVGSPNTEQQLKSGWALRALMGASPPHLCAAITQRRVTPARAPGSPPRSGAPPPALASAARAVGRCAPQYSEGTNTHRHRFRGAQPQAAASGL